MDEQRSSRHRIRRRRTNRRGDALGLSERRTNRRRPDEYALPQRASPFDRTRLEKCLRPKDGFIDVDKLLS